MIQHHVWVAVIHSEPGGYIVSDDHIVGRQALISLVTHRDPGTTYNLSCYLRASVGAVIHHRVVDNPATMQTAKGHPPAGAGDNNIVCYRQVRPIAVEGVDALELVPKRQFKVSLPDHSIAVDHDIAVVAGISLHAVWVGAVREIEVVMNIILTDQNITCIIVDPVVAKVFYLVAETTYCSR